mmetsp:Transcript_32401/g.32701  ORF Transcript_32401/g.32701 Transcript_32401/m.32701 type:complete len:322 (-) Transcript_32401:254-1219(-)
MRRNDKDTDNGIPTNKPKEPELKATRDPQLFFARLLQYAECPQYLRRHFFPMHPDLQYVGVMNPLDAPHHVRAGEESVYREGVVLPELFPKKGEEDLEGSHKVNCGILKKPVVINTRLTPGVRCTVQIPKAEYGKKNVAGTVVSPDAPREFDGRYWGYQTRLADSLAKIFDECPYEGGYDLKVGTSERGDVSIDDAKFALVKGGKETKGAKTSFQHAMIVFGGVAGIEECVDADESLTLPGKDSRQLFDVWVNTCPYQGSRTIRTEEAVMITLARLRPYLFRNTPPKGAIKTQPSATAKQLENVSFSDDASDESSSDEESE